MKIEVTQTVVPNESLITESLERNDYLDAFVGRFKSNRDITCDKIFIAFFKSAPNWVVSLLKTRNKIVGYFGLKVPKVLSQNEIESFIAVEGASLGLFKIFKRNESEIVAGEDDRHLNFRALQPFECKG